MQVLPPLFLPPFLPFSFLLSSPFPSPPFHTDCRIPQISVPPSCSSHVTLSSNIKNPILTPSVLFPAPSCHLPIADLCVVPPGAALHPHGLLARHTGAAQHLPLGASSSSLCGDQLLCPQLSFALAVSSADPWCVCQASPPPGTRKP